MHMPAATQLSSSHPSMLSIAAMDCQNCLNTYSLVNLALVLTWAIGHVRPVFSSKNAFFAIHASALKGAILQNVNAVLRYSDVLHLHQQVCHSIGDTIARASRFTVSVVSMKLLLVASSPLQKRSSRIARHNDQLTSTAGSQ